MSIPFHILADGDDIGKVVFGVIAVIVWIVSAVSSSINKQKKEREQRERELVEMARQGVLRPAPTPPPPPLPRRGPTPPPRAPQRAAPLPPVPVQQQRQQRQGKKKQQKQRIPVPPLPQRAGPPSVAQLEEIVKTASQRAPAAAGSAKAHPIAGLLRKSLRNQIVLSEILQPPLALREPREI